MSPFAPLISRLRDFKDKEHGSASVEFVLWMPLFVAITMLVIDTSVLCTSQSNYWSVSRDTARLVSRYAMTEADAEAYATAQASILWSAPTADVTINGSTVTVNLTAPATELSIFNALGFASAFDISASVTHAMEPV